MTATDRAAALELARSHIAGHEADMRQYPDCVRCYTTMDSDCEPSAFCVGCIYVVADALSEQLLAAEAERESLAAHVEALEANAVSMREYRFALEGIPTDGKGNPLCDRWLSIPGDARCQLVFRHEGQCGLATKATTDTERHDG